LKFALPEAVPAPNAVARLFLPIAPFIKMRVIPMLSLQCGSVKGAGTRRCQNVPSLRVRLNIKV
jgi:hypothetical protein